MGDRSDGHEKEDADIAAAVTIPDELLAQMDEERILEDDVYRTIAYCERTGTRVRPARDVYIGHLRAGVITYWWNTRRPKRGMYFEECSRTGWRSWNDER